MQINHWKHSAKLYRMALLLLCLLTGCTSSKMATEAVLDTKTTGQTTQQTETTEKQQVSTENANEYTVDNYLENMTIQDKAAQILFVHVTAENLAQLTEVSVGGVILFADFFQDKDTDTVISDIKSMQEQASLPMLVGVDEEGGEVVRVSKYTALYHHKFQSPQELYQEGGMEAIAADTKEKSQLLIRLGINVNLAPVADVSTASSDYIYKRTFGQDALATADYVSLVVEVMKQQGIGSVLKHFPGYGNNQDTHTGFAYDERPYSEFEDSDFIPFEAGISAGANSVLVSHNIVACMDEKLPASLSANVHDILRDTMGFQGVILTDDLAMDAISEADFGESPAVLALLAGNDMIITTDYKQHFDDILQALKDGTITEDALDEAVRRILLWKIELGLIDVMTETY